MREKLSIQLSEGTKKAHTMAENVGFVRCFLRGAVDKTSYRNLIANLYFVYTAMEQELRVLKKHPIISKIYFPELNRKSSLEKDLCFYYGNSWQESIEPSAAANNYVERIHEVATTHPELLIAHSYTRYLGDLSGGQILKGIAERSMNLSNGAGTAFYEFESIPDAKEFKEAYRQALNELPINETVAHQIVDEANAAFGLNMLMFQELEGSLIKAIGQMLFNTLTRRRKQNGPNLAIAE
ncbi:biliverdin-producing heme oxygenase [Acaryochloris marina]|uniref:heme oxygenase (biliverdin-producing) n=1 Tax=Acaryochloris marina (strain MBIC 11017) TaxID=329726 RepID=A8ZMK5_ACAM1|nr:heme oxygenase (biliverdin-producing) [Acaryochloris marina]ABW32141.1 heme oxygenase 1 [Acaryochloris marina MBIC11017]ABW32416.1 heme oxygenase [Acaryochloris marina MBIC11017]